MMRLLNRGGAAALLGLALGCVAASAQTPAVARANALYADVPSDQRSERILLPALLELEPPPLALADPEEVPLVLPGGEAWSAAITWADAAPQRAALDALRRATEPRAFEDAMAFAQPYGVRGIDPSLIGAGLFTDLGDPPLLAAASFGYLDAIERLRSLVHIEATRLAFDGRAAEAAGLLFRVVILGRQLVDREMLEEVDRGYRIMIDGLRRIRDVVHIDFSGERAADTSRLRDLIDQLRFDGPLALERQGFPRADRIAGEQLVDTVYEIDRGALTEPFVQTMARLESTGRPLRRFSAAARWAGAAERQISEPAIRRAIEEVHEGWTRFWELPSTASVLSRPFPLASYDENTHAVLFAALAPERDDGTTIDGRDLFEHRRHLDVERVGTRQALGVVAAYYTIGRFPPQVTSIRPQWVGEIEPDLFDEPDLNVNAFARLEYFVPRSDAMRLGERGNPEPHRMEVFSDRGENFAVELFNDDFVLYSTGPNGVDDAARRVSQDPDTEIGDYLIWPPVLSLYRQFLVEQGRLP